MDDVVLWITLFIHNALGPSWISVPQARMRRMLATLVVPALFGLGKLREDFPKESIDNLATATPLEPSLSRRGRQA
jgi:hypothetical protein